MAEFPFIHHIVVDPFETHIFPTHHRTTRLEVKRWVRSNFIDFEEVGGELFGHPDLVFEERDDILIIHERQQWGCWFVNCLLGFDYIAHDAVVHDDFPELFVAFREFVPDVET